MQKGAEGFFERRDGVLWYRIDDVYSMEDFFITLPSSGDIWAFMWSQGGITAGRMDADHAIFPYATDDKVSDMKYSTGSLSMIRSGETVWYVFDPSARASHSISMPRDLSKLRLEQSNDTLGLAFSETWETSERFGLIRRIMISARNDISLTLLDGARNLMPAGAASALQNASSTLLDAYKKTEVEKESGLVSLALSSIVTDKAEPSEALIANVTYFTTDGGYISLDPHAEESFLEGEPKHDTESLGERGAAFIVKEISLKAGETYSHMQVFDTSYSTARFENLRSWLIRSGRAAVAKAIDDDIRASEARLDRLIAEADGIEDTGDMMATVHHEANTLFNIMRGGTFISDRIPVADFKDFAYRRNRKIASSIAYPDKDEAGYEEMRKALSGDRQSRRLFSEYIPLTFSRRHGDPSRPWNRFSIKVANEKGEPILSYEGNWRDIFQNWEALSLSYPMYIDHMISRFLDTMTVDGYNPYRINRDGFEWEEPDPDDPWAAIGYWNDHQVIYLVRLLELSQGYSRNGVAADLSSPRFSSAAVPYRLRSYDEIERNPHSTIIFDHKLNKAIKERAEKMGNDGKLVLDSNGNPELVSLSTKIMQIIVSKLASFVPDGGIWMNTQRPEWNDANNALAGYGLSIVSTAAVRLLLSWFIGCLEESGEETIGVSEAVGIAFRSLAESYSSLSDDLDDKERLAFVRENGRIFEYERELLYREGFSAETMKIRKEEAISALRTMLASIDRTLLANKRSDGLYHSYNIMMIKGDGMKVERMKLQLEGQVALLSSGLVSPEDAVSLMKALRKSPLHEKRSGAYLLYPDRHLHAFWEKNRIEDVDTDLAAIRCTDGLPVLEQDDNGIYHFRSSIRNVECLREAIGGGNEKLEALYEKTFSHRFFTGRSDSFYRYEGLGSIYWHMVSKLLLAIGEIAEKAEDERTRQALISEYMMLRSSLGYKRSDADYGSFPFMPYSHTPKGKGAKQPGMTGQVKEEIITRNLELGAITEGGCFRIAPFMLERSEFKEDGTLSFTRFGVPITYRLHDGESIMLSINGSEMREGGTFTVKESQALFARDGRITHIEAMIPRSMTI